MNMIKSATATAAVSTLLAAAIVLVGCQPANASLNTLPIDLYAGYTDNGVIDKQGATIKAGTEYGNLMFGVSAFTTEKSLETYGAYLGVPLRVQNTKIVVTPIVAVDKYRKANETVGSIGLGLGYGLTKTVSLDALAMTSRSLSGNRHEMRGETYSVGLTKRF